MYVLTPDEMRALDREAIKGLGIPGMVLMENAGRTIAEVIGEHVELDSAAVAIVAGPGNNGGDGFVIARYLFERTADLSVFLLGSEKDVRGDALKNLRILEKMGIDVSKVDQVTEELEHALGSADVVVDALFGTGFRGTLEGAFKDVVSKINETSGLVVAVDIPSGVSGSTGEVLGEPVMADITVTMAYPKIGHFLYPGRHFVGELVVADIGMPPSMAEGKVRTRLLDRERTRGMIPPRLGPEHKGDFGRILTLAGSKGYTGAATLSALAALRVGAGLSYLALPESLNAIAEVKATEVITIPVTDKDGVITKSAVREIMGRGIDFDAIAVGPGLTRSEPVKIAVSELLSTYPGPLVIDADGVVVLKGILEALRQRVGETVLTPHPGELGAVLGRPADEISESRIPTARDFARNYGVVVVLKGAPTVIANPDGDIWLNSTGNPGLAKGGTGDVLTGLIAGFLGQRLEAEDAALLGVYIHGLAGDLASLDLTEHCVMAEDVLDFVPESFEWLIEDGEEE